MAGDVADHDHPPVLDPEQIVKVATGAILGTTPTTVDPSVANLTGRSRQWADAGLQIVGLDADGDVTLDEFDGSGPVVVVVGSEGKGLSRLVRQNCDAVVSIPMAGPAESLNASVAAGVVLAEIARQRR